MFIAQNCVIIHQQNVLGKRRGHPCIQPSNEFFSYGWLELVVDHDHVKYFVNGKLVNEATDLSATKGKILFQTEGAETFYRNLELAPLK
jgi:Domain of Unknown Function (DUF1080)